MYSPHEQTLQNEIILQMNSYQPFEQQFQKISYPEVYGNQIIIMEETNLFLVNQNMNEYGDSQVSFQTESSLDKNQLQGNHPPFEYTHQENIQYLPQQVLDIEGQDKLSTTVNTSARTYLGKSVSLCDDLYLLLRSNFSSYYPKNTLENLKQGASKLESQAPSPNIGPGYETQYCPGTNLVIPKIESHPNEYDLEVKHNFFQNQNQPIKLPLTCPVKSCHYHLTKFHYRAQLLKHCFHFHVKSGRIDRKQSLQEKVLLSKIIPHCEYCKRFFSRKDSLLRHIRQKHG